MVLASELYMEEDYIRDYDEFLKFIKEKKAENALSKQAGGNR